MNGNQKSETAKQDGSALPDDALEIVLAEYRYWSQGNSIEVSIGATAAAANIYCALAGIHRAPWHPKLPGAEQSND